MSHYFHTLLNILGVNENRKAKNILVKPGFQLKLPLYILLLTVSFLFFAMLLGNLYLEQAYVTMIENTTQSEYLQQIISDQIGAFKVIIVLLLVMYAALVLVITSTYTHRMFGPMIPIARHLKAMKEGFYAHRVSLRKHDALHEFADQLNELAEVLERRK